MSRRVFLIVLDSFGIGAAPDAADFGDAGANTLRSIAGSARFRADNLIRLGLGNIDGVTLDRRSAAPAAAYGRARELSRGKDTTVGHWEIAGLISPEPLPTFPDGFPDDLIGGFERRTGRHVLCNRPYSGTQVIADYGDEQARTGDLIVYTSADSVFQIAAHEEVVPLDELYRCCRIAREMLSGDMGVGRVIARPFRGVSGAYYRTAGRHDFSLAPPKTTMLDAIAASGMDSIAVGKIEDIFAGRGITEHIFTRGNDEGMTAALEVAARDFSGLCFINLVDFDMLYGHRNDIDGYAAAIAAFDAWLPSMTERLGEEDILILTADHGCDPGYTVGNDHSREYIPLLVCGRRVAPVNLGTLDGFCDIGKTVLDYLGIDSEISGVSFLNRIIG